MTWNAAAQALLDSGAGFDVRWLLHVTPKDRVTGDPVPYGMWTGKLSREFDIGNGPETFQGMFGHFVPPVIKYEPGTYIRTTRVQFVGLSPGVQNVLDAYDPRLAPAELWCAILNGAGEVIDMRRRFKGFVNEAPRIVPPVNGVTQAEIELVSTARRGTATISAKKSDVMQQRRGGDRFRRYGSVGTVAADIWGAAK